VSKYLSQIEIHLHYSIQKHMVKKNRTMLGSCCIRTCRGRSSTNQILLPYIFVYALQALPNQVFSWFDFDQIEFSSHDDHYDCRRQPETACYCIQENIFTLFLFSILKINIKLFMKKLFSLCDSLYSFSYW